MILNNKICIYVSVYIISQSLSSATHILASFKSFYIYFPAIRFVITGSDKKKSSEYTKSVPIRQNPRNPASVM